MVVFAIYIFMTSNYYYCMVYFPSHFLGADAKTKPNAFVCVCVHLSVTQMKMNREKNE